jgi:hypothetical protein
LTQTGVCDDYQAVVDARLELKLERLAPPMEGSDLLLGVGETQNIEATIVAENCRECHATIEFDERHFDLVEGSPDLDVGSGSFTRTVMWRLRARSPGDELRIEISAFEGAAQLVTLPTRIHPMPKIED